MRKIRVLPTSPADSGWVRRLIEERWGSPIVVVHGVVYHPHEMPGLKALRGEKPVGLVTYRIEGPSCEVVTLDSLSESSGVGSALLEAVRGQAQEAGCTRLWLVTTNDNLNALRFYQKRGLQLVSVRPNAVGESRKIKPSIPLLGDHGIPLRDELELECTLI